jgi:hypothetical protein
VIEPQGRFWHSAFARWGDGTRAFIIEGLGYRYHELWEEDILAQDDTWLDGQIQQIVGGLVPRVDLQILGHPRNPIRIVRFIGKVNPLKEARPR